MQGNAHIDEGDGDLNSTELSLSKTENADEGPLSHSSGKNPSYSALLAQDTGMEDENSTEPKTHNGKDPGKDNGHGEGISQHLSPENGEELMESPAEHESLLSPTTTILFLSV